VTTKLPYGHPGRVPESINESLQNAGLDYYDMVCISRCLLDDCASF
jgi:hypothetical protein